MRRLTGLDSAFLALETPTSTGHVGGLSILDPRTAPEPVDLDGLTRLIASRIDRVPVMRERLMEVPLGIDQPVWVDDEHFDIGYHVREASGSPSQARTPNWQSRSRASTLAPSTAPAPCGRPISSTASRAVGSRSTPRSTTRRSTA